MDTDHGGHRGVPGPAGRVRQDRVTLVHAVYDQIPAILARLGLPSVQGVLFDLGVSSPQLDDPTAASPTPMTRRWTCGWTPAAR